MGWVRLREGEWPQDYAANSKMYRHLNPSSAQYLVHRHAIAYVPTSSQKNTQCTSDSPLPPAPAIQKFIQKCLSTLTETSSNIVPGILYFSTHTLHPPWPIKLLKWEKTVMERNLLDQRVLQFTLSSRSLTLDLPPNSPWYPARQLPTTWYIANNNYRLFTVFQPLSLLHDSSHAQANLK